MNERQKIEARLRKKEQEIQNLAKRIEAGKVYVKALRDILKMLDNGSESEAAESTLRQGSAVAQARDVILQFGTPVHITALLNALGKPPTREARASLASSIAAYVRRGDIFVRTAPNTFGLAELGHTIVGENENSEPPAGFGQMSSPTPDLDDDIPF